MYNITLCINFKGCFCYYKFNYNLVYNYNIQNEKLDKKLWYFIKSKKKIIIPIQTITIKLKNLK